MTVLKIQRLKHNVNVPEYKTIVGLNCQNFLMMPAFPGMLKRPAKITAAWIAIVTTADFVRRELSALVMANRMLISTANAK